MSTRVHGQHAPFDINPDDLAARIELRDRLRQMRLDRGYSQRKQALSMGWRASGLNARESKPDPNFELGTMIVWANTFDHHFWLRPVGVWCYRDNAQAQLLAAIGDDSFQHAAITERLVAARRAAVVGPTELARRIGTSCECLTRFEEQAANKVLTSAWQRYARGLGGQLDLVLTPFEPEQVSA